MKYFSGEELCIPQDCPTPRAATVLKAKAVVVF